MIFEVTKMKKFLFFMTPMCPNCGEIKDWLEENPKLLEKGEIIDATRPQGLQKAKDYGVDGVPSIVLLDDKGKKISIARDLEEFQELAENKTLGEY